MNLKTYIFAIFLSVCFFLGSPATAERLESKYGYLFYKYNEGDIDEVIASATVAINNKKNASTPNRFYFKTYCLLAKAHYDNADFEKAKAIEQAFVNLLGTVFPVTERFDIYHALADYYLYIGNFNEALIYNGKAQDKSNTELENNLLQLQLATIKAKTGWLNQALEMVLPLENYFNSLISTKTSNAEFKLSAINKNDLLFKTSVFAELLILKNEIYLGQGDDDNAAINISKSKKLIKENLGRPSTHYARVCKQEGQMFQNESNIDKAINAYTEAFAACSSFDKNPTKIEILFQNIVCHIYNNQPVQTDALLRKLQILANSNSGLFEPFQPYYNLALAVKQFYWEDPSQGIYDLEAFLKEYGHLPKNHPSRLSALAMGAKWSQEQLNPIKAVGFINDIIHSQNPFLASNSPYLDKWAAYKGVLVLKYVGIADSLRQVVEKDLPNQLLQLHPVSFEMAFLQSFLADYYFKVGLLDSAVIHANLATNIHPNENGLKIYYNLKSAYYLLLKGKISQANEILATYELEQKNLSNQDPEKLKCTLLLREIYGITGQYDKENKLKSEMVSFSKARLTHKNLELEVENNIALGAIYLQSGNFLKAQKQLQNAYQIVKTKVPYSSIALELFHLMAQLDIIKGNYPQADKYVTTALEISAKGFGEKGVTYARAKIMAAQYYEAIADYKKALDDINVATTIQNTVYGTNNFNNIDILLLKAKIKVRSSKFDVKEVMALYDNAIKLARTSLGENNPIYINVLIRNAEFLITVENFVEAKNLLSKAVAYYQNVKGESSVSAELAFLSGKMYYGSKDYKNALKYFKESSDQYKSIFSINHPLYNKSKGHEARSLFMLKQYNNSLDVMEEIIPTYLKIVDKLFPSMSFGQKGNYWNSIKDEFEFFNFLICSQFITEKPSEISKVFNNVISTKAILLASDTKVRQKIFTSGDTLLISLYDSWVEKKEVMNTAYALSKTQLAEQGIDLPLLENQIDQLEKSINTRSQLFDTEANKRKIDWQNIRDVLTPDEAVVEMVHFRYFNHKFLDSALYAALVVTQQTRSNPLCVIIPNASHLEKRYFKYYRNAIIKKLNDNLTYKNFWQPIDNQLKGIKTIYFSPDGVYSQMNPETFTTPTNKCLFDQYKFRFISNSKDILNQPPLIKKTNGKSQPQNDNYIICGNPEFYVINEQAANRSVPSLPGAEQEINEISVILKSSLNIQLLVGKSVTEDTLVKMNSPKVFHIATHGFFKENTPEDDNNFMANPLLNSGLMLKGSGDLFDAGLNVNAQKGILTAMEAATLKLDGTELVVLSACETGRGEVVNGEGVYGLQRSLFIAGAKAVVMTLFKVNDEVTQKFMKYFYESWLVSANKNQSFNYAKTKVKEQHPEAIYWGAFVMLESMPKFGN